MSWFKFFGRWQVANGTTCRLSGKVQFEGSALPQ